MQARNWPKRPRFIAIGLPQFSQASSISPSAPGSGVSSSRVFSHSGIAAAGEEQAELAGLDHHRLAALVARDRRIRLIPFLEVGHVLLGALQVLLELLVEARERGLVVRRCPPRSCRDPPRARACSSTSRMSSNAGLSSFSTSIVPRNVGLNRAFDLVHVLARLDHADDRRVGARAADAVLFERLDERRFAVARRRLRELLLRLQLAQRRARSPFASGGSTLGLLVVLRRRRVRARPASAPPRRLDRRVLVVDREPAGELRHRALDAEQIVARPSMSTVVSSNVAGGICEATKRFQINL